MTKTQAETSIERAAYFAYAALLCALFDWANLERFLLRINTGIHGQLLTVAPGRGLSTLVRAASLDNKKAPGIRGLGR